MPKVELADLIKKSSIPPPVLALEDEHIEDEVVTIPLNPPYHPTEWDLAKVIILDDDGEF